MSNLRSAGMLRLTSTMFSRCCNTMLLSALLRSNDNVESFPALPCPTSQHRLILSTTLSRRSTSHVPLFSAPFYYKHNAESFVAPLSCFIRNAEWPSIWIICTFKSGIVFSIHVPFFVVMFFTTKIPVFNFFFLFQKIPTGRRCVRHLKPFLFEGSGH